MLRRHWEQLLPTLRRQLRLRQYLQLLRKQRQRLLLLLTPTYLGGGRNPSAKVWARRPISRREAAGLSRNLIRFSGAWDAKAPRACRPF